MSAFDPNNVRKAVSEFTPRHQEKFENLLPARDVIVELRQRRVSFRAIAELLTQHCLPAGKTAIADFCHEVLGETTRPHRRTTKKRLPAFEPQGETKFVLPAPATSTPGEPPNPEAAAERPRGPRIARVYQRECSRSQSEQTVHFHDEIGRSVVTARHLAPTQARQNLLAIKLAAQHCYFTVIKLPRWGSRSPKSSW